jgi:DNA-binding NtrC family response regulator
MAVANLIIAYDEPTFAIPLEIGLRRAGHTVSVFSEPLEALNALETTRDVGMLITRVRFSPGQPHGIALARMARLKHARIQILFVARAEFAEEAKDLGEFIPMPANVVEVVKAVERMMKSSGRLSG